VKLPGGPFSAQKISGMADMGLGRDYNRITTESGRHCGGMKFMVDSAPQMCYFISIIDMSRLDMLMVDILSKSYVRRDIVG
jgi:hypothetical protein